MSVLRFILFSFFYTYTNIQSAFYSIVFSLSPFVSLSYKLTSQGKLKQISWSRERARAHFSLRAPNSLNAHDCAHAATWAQLTLIVFYIAVSFSLLVTQMAVAVGALAKNYNHNQKKISFFLFEKNFSTGFLRQKFCAFERYLEKSGRARAPLAVKSFKTCYIFVLFVYTQFFLFNNHHYII